MVLFRLRCFFRRVCSFWCLLWVGGGFIAKLRSKVAWLHHRHQPVRHFDAEFFITTGLLVLGAIVTDKFFVDVEREVEVQATWTEDSADGKPIIRFHFLNLKEFDGMESSSSEVLKYLKTLNQPEVKVTVVLVYDFGKIRALEGDHAKINGIEFRLLDE